MIRITKSLFKFFSIISPFRYFNILIYIYFFFLRYQWNRKKEKKKGKHHVSLIRKHIFISMLENKSEITYTKKKKGQITAMEQLRRLTQDR